MVPAGSRVADVGTDHGLLAWHVLASGRAAHCIASEPTPDRLEKARRGRPPWAVGREPEFRAGNGLDVLAPDDRLDVIVIAGLGGHAICQLLAHPGLPSLGIRRLVLQPQTEHARVREWLGAHGFGIVDERMVHERDRFYVLVAAEPGSSPEGGSHLSPEDLLEAGPCLVRSGDPVVIRYWEQRLAIHERILGRARSGRGRDESRRQRDLASRVLSALRSSSE